MTAFESVLNFVMPIVAVVGFLYLMYKAMKPSLQGIGGLFTRAWKKVRGQDDLPEADMPVYIEYN